VAGDALLPSRKCILNELVISFTESLKLSSGLSVTYGSLLLRLVESPTSIYIYVMYACKCMMW